MVLLNTVTRCSEAEAPFYWQAQGLSESEAQPSPHGPAAAQLSHTITPGL